MTPQEREAAQMALDALEKLNKDGWILADFEDEVYASIEALRARLAQPEQEMADEDWHEIWEQFDWDHPDIEEEFQKEMVAKHGEAHYYMDADESWKRQKKLIQKLVEAKLKEKNT